MAGKKVFLGGTCNNSTWRDQLEEKLTIESFNPVVKEWNDAAYQQELHERETCDFCLYVITPLMNGIYSIAELVDDSNKRPEKTIFCFLQEDGETKFSSHQLKSLNATAKMVVKNGGKYFESLEDVATYLNASSLSPA